MVRAALELTPIESLAAGLQAFAADEGLMVQSLRRSCAVRLDRLIDGIVAGLWLLLAMGFVVGGIAVANTLTMSVLEQTRELGLLRIVGMTRWQIRKLVFCESSLLGILGAVTGTLAGIRNGRHHPLVQRARCWGIPCPSRCTPGCWPPMWADAC